MRNDWPVGENIQMRDELMEEDDRIASPLRMKKDNRRDAILKEATKALGEKGYHGFSVNEVARRCGITTAGLLYHFGSKQELLVAILKRRDELDEKEIVATFGTNPRRRPDSLQDCFASLRAIVAQNASQPELVRLFSILRTEALVPDHPAFAYFRTRDIAIIEIFRNMVAELVPDPLSTARQIIALMNGLEQQWLREARIFDLLDEWDKAIVKILKPIA